MVVVVLVVVLAVLGLGWKQQSYENEFSVVQAVATNMKNSCGGHKILVLVLW